MISRLSPSPRSVLACVLLLAACGPTDVTEVTNVGPNDSVDVVYIEGDVPPAFRVVVPPAATALHVYTEGANVPVQLLVAPGELPVPPEDEMMEKSECWLDADVLIDVTSRVGLVPGEWFITPAPADPDLDIALRDVVGFTLNTRTFAPDTKELPLDRPADVILTREVGLRAAFLVELPPELQNDSSRIRVEVRSDDADVDLVVGPPEPDRTLWEFHAVSNSGMSFERLSLEASELGERFAVHVHGYPDIDSRPTVRARVLVTEDRPGAPSLCPLPEMPPDPGEDPLARALAATVVVHGPLGIGSGVVISPEGHVLTNAHVVVGGVPVAHGLADVAVGFSGDHHRGPVPSWGARQVGYREDLDLALLLIDSTLDRRPLPPGLEFPFLELADGEPRIGAPVRCVGYPMTGGSGTLVSITVTRGIISGYSREREGIQYKTDADIHSGMSGGACIDEANRLIGIPSTTLSDYYETGGLGFLAPVDAIPAEWREMIGR